MPVLKKGSRGPDVADLQRLLTAAGWPCKDDGVFGQITENAVKEYQAEHGLTVDGKAGERTMASLRGQITSSPPAVEIWGVDVAEFNSPDYDGLAAADCAFAIVRAMTGSDSKGKMREDAKFRVHLAGFERVKIPVVGAYAWTVPSRSGVEQARLMRSICDGLDVFRALDHEPIGTWRDPVGATNTAVGFVRELACDGRKTPVYTGEWALRQAPLPTLGDCPLWLSHFGLTHWPAPVAPWSVVTLWQCGYVDPNAPETKRIDKNVFRGTLADLRRAMG